MSKYVISDIHGQFDMFMELIEKIKFYEKDDIIFVQNIGAMLTPICFPLGFSSQWIKTQTEERSVIFIGVPLESQIPSLGMFSNLSQS